MRGYQGSEKPSEGLLTHATVANRRAAKPRGAKTDRAALAPAGVEGSVHRAMSQVVPSFESFTTTPSAASSSRMRSDSLKFFAARAAALASIRLATCFSSMESDAGRKDAHFSAVNCSNPTSCALAFNEAAADLAPFAASPRKSCKAAKAFGVLRSSNSPPSASAQINPG